MKRIQYLDVMRGVTMLLVIYQHIRSYSIGLALEDSDFASLFILFRMPMFFFLSGYIAYKSCSFFDFSHYKERLLTKAKVELIPTIVFFILLSLYLNDSVDAYGFPGWYWFTVVLFEMFVIYFTCSLLSHYINAKILLPLLVISAIGITFIPVPEGKLIHTLCLSQLRGYLRFFVLGIICRKYQERFISTFERNLPKTILIVTCLILLLFHHLCIISEIRLIDFTMEFVLKSSLVGIVFMFFYSSRDFWTRDSFLAKVFNFIGRRTLDLYMLHYFFLPDLPQLYNFFAAKGNEVIEFITLMSITLLITAVSLLVSYVFRCSPFLAEWLFGNKIKPQNT